MPQHCNARHWPPTKPLCLPQHARTKQAGIWMTGAWPHMHRQSYFYTCAGMRTRPPVDIQYRFMMRAVIDKHVCVGRCSSCIFWTLCTRYSETIPLQQKMNMNITSNTKMEGTNGRYWIKEATNPRTTINHPWRRSYFIKESSGMFLGTGAQNKAL